MYKSCISISGNLEKNSTPSDSIILHHQSIKTIPTWTKAHLDAYLALSAGGSYNNSVSTSGSAGKKIPWGTSIVHHHHIVKLILKWTKEHLGAYLVSTAAIINLCHELG
jgi:hypothetical protein